MRVNREIFRQYDIRGIVGKDVTEETAYLIGKAFGTYIQDKAGKRVAVGRDVRLSSTSFKNSLVKGLLSTGCEVIDVGVVPTPVLYFSIYHFGTDGGVMVTASHNPKEYNGFKICVGLFSIYGEEIQKIYRMIEEGSFREGKGSVSEADPRAAYIKEITGKVKVEKGLKIAADFGNGTAGEVATSLFQELGVELLPLYTEPDGRFPNHLPDPTIPEYMRDLSELVKKENALLGIGFDGDGDRIGVVDEKGDIVWGDKLLGIFAKKVLKNLPGATIIMDVKCSQGVAEYIEKLGGKPLIWKTGHSLIKEKMRETGAPLSGEMSGHMFFKDNYLGYDDAIFAAARLLEIISEEHKPISELINEIPAYYSTPEIRVDCPEKEKARIVEDVKNYFSQKFPVIDVDGIRFITPRGWGLIRASNTQPILVLRFEAKGKEALEELKQQVKERFKKYPFLPLDW
ncbi:MAG: phosphomannomutase/phosphoglucomutase [Caldiserica bacterium]|nr:phosphomannomutase/phosphoglucomutase [Caldisericota bacterium]